MVGPILMAVVMAEHNFSKNITMPFLSRTVLQYSDISEALLAPDIRTTFPPQRSFSFSSSRKGQSWPNLDDYSSIVCIGSVLV